MQADLDRLPDSDWRRLAQVIYSILNFSMMYVSMNMIVAIICDTNVDVRKEVFYQDWLSLTARYAKEKMKRIRMKTRYIFKPQIDDQRKSDTL